MRWVQEIREALGLGPSRHDKQKESMRAIKAQHALREGTARLRKVTTELPRKPMESVHPA